MRRLALVLLLACTGCAAVKAGARPGSGVPLALELARFPAGLPWTLAADRGSVVFLDFWATWCDPCREALPLYADLAREYGPRGLKVYAVSVDADPAPIGPFLKEAKVDLPVLLDPEGRLAESVLKVQVMPTAFLIDRAGVVRSVHEGYDEARLPATLAEVESLLEE